MIIGITGTNGAGKGATVDYLVTKGLIHYSVRDELTKLLEKEGVFVDRSALRAKANELRKEHGADYLARLMYQRVVQNGSPSAVIESIRTTSEAEYLQSQGAFIIALDAERRKRYERIKGRMSRTDFVDFATFIEQEEREWHGAEGSHDMNIMRVFDIADYRIENNGTLGELHSAIEKVFQ